MRQRTIRIEMDFESPMTDEQLRAKVAEMQAEVRESIGEVDEDGQRLIAVRARLVR